MNTMVEHKVNLCGLERNIEFNDELVTILNYDKTKNRYIVLFANGEKGRVKPHNIKCDHFDKLRGEGSFSIGAAPPRPNAKKPKWRPKKKQTNECAICMEDMKGRVTLQCGHILCPSCFARHSRVNNTCPFCRDVFAPEIEGRSRISTSLGEQMVVEAVKDYYNDEDVESELSEMITNVVNDNTEVNRSKLNASVYACMDGACQMLYYDIDDWYDEND
jgi:hypothetical protein|tara:strand:- start:9 stop:662 length:654 start_codon:yes stop_codon:yes gene_type:complete